MLIQQVIASLQVSIKPRVSMVPNDCHKQQCFSVERNEANVNGFCADSQPHSGTHILSMALEKLCQLSWLGALSLSSSLQLQNVVLHSFVACAHSGSFAIGTIIAQ